MATVDDAATPATATAGASNTTESRPATALSNPNFRKFASVVNILLPDIDFRIPFES